MFTNQQAFQTRQHQPTTSRIHDHNIHHLLVILAPLVKCNLAFLLLCPNEQDHSENIKS